MDRLETDPNIVAFHSSQDLQVPVFVQCAVAVPNSARLQQYRADTLRQPKPLQCIVSKDAGVSCSCHLSLPAVIQSKIGQKKQKQLPVYRPAMFEELAGFDKYASMFPGNHLHGFEQVVNCMKLPPALLDRSGMMSVARRRVRAGLQGRASAS